MNRISRLAPLVVWITCGWSAAALAQTATITGRIVDARTGSSRVLVMSNTGAFAETDDTGGFSCRCRGTTRYRVADRHAIVRQTVDLAAGAPREMVIELSEGAGSFEEKITVTGAAPNQADEAPAGSVLHGRDLQALRGVMLDDPLRAVQALPAAASTNDFYSEFSVRGNGFRYIGLAIDGIPASYLIHSIHDVPAADRRDGQQQLAPVVAQQLSAAPRAPAARSVTTRDGNRNGVHGRAGLSGTSANAIVEGPLTGGKGSWVASVRRSYLDFLLDRIDPEGNFGFGFSDALGKLTFDVNPKHQLQLLTIAGRSTFDEAPEDISVNDEAVARSRAWLAAATWRFTPGPRLSMTQRVCSGHTVSQRQRARHAPRRRQASDGART